MNILDHCLGFVMSSLWRKSAQLPPIEDSLLLIPAHELAVQIRTNKVKSESVVRAYINRIQQVNPIINAVVDRRFEAALHEARVIDQFVESGEKTEDEIARDTPLLGVPITIKEHVAVEGMHWTGGLVARKDKIASTNAEVVQHVKRAGAIVLGTTNVPELCCEWANCVNCVYGRTLNPYDTRRITGASSGGEGSILSAAGSVVGIGSDIAGSIRSPSMFNGVFGHKPTWRMISNQGLYPELKKPLSQYLTTGPMCRYARDLKLLLRVMVGNEDDRLHLDEQVSLEDLQFFYVCEIDGCTRANTVDGEIKDANEKVIQYLEEKFNTKVQRPRIDNLCKSFPIMYNAIWNGKRTLTDALAAEEASVNLCTEFFKWMLNSSSHTLSFLLLLLSESKALLLSDTTCARLEQECTKLRQELQELLGDRGVLLLPTHPTTALYHSQPLLRVYNMMYSGIFNILGLPATHCPLGLSSERLPLGVQVVSSLYNDRLCLAVAEELERGFGGWVKPS